MVHDTLAEVRHIGSQIEATCRKEIARGSEQLHQDLQAITQEIQELSSRDFEASHSGLGRTTTSTNGPLIGTPLITRVVNAFSQGGRHEPRKTSRFHYSPKKSLTQAELKARVQRKERVAALPPRAEHATRSSVFNPKQQDPQEVWSYSDGEEEDGRPQYQDGVGRPPSPQPTSWPGQPPQSLRHRPFTPDDVPPVFLQGPETPPTLPGRTATNARAASVARAIAWEEDAGKSGEQAASRSLRKLADAGADEVQGRKSSGVSKTSASPAGLGGSQAAAERDSKCSRFQESRTQTDDLKTLSTIEACSDQRGPVHSRLSLRLELTRASMSKDQRGRDFRDDCIRAPWRTTARSILYSTRFDNIISLMIMLNAVTIGAETNYCATLVTDHHGSCQDSPFVYRFFEVFFCVVFTAELSLRIYVRGSRFLLKRELAVLWNWFDFLVVMAQLTQECIGLLSSSSIVSVDNFRVLRVLRILRVVRIFRLVRVLHLISELRTIVSSIMGSFKSLGWTVVLLFLMIYIVGTFFTQTVTDHIEEAGYGANTGSYNVAQLKYYYGSLSKTILALWQSITGGADWDTMARPMIHEVHPLMGLAFCAYIAFALLALMNVVTGVFVQTALQSAQSEEDSFLTDQIVALFSMADRDKTAMITLQEIQERLDDPEAAKEWKSINVSADEATFVFELLDVTKSGEVYFEEFLSACIRLRGPAKSIDMLTMMQEARARNRRWQMMFNKLDADIKSVRQMQELLWQQTDQRRAADGRPFSPLSAAGLGPGALTLDSALESVWKDDESV